MRSRIKKEIPDVLFPWERERERERERGREREREGERERVG
jgi:hypothetical protein